VAEHIINALGQHTEDHYHYNSKQHYTEFPLNTQFNTEFNLKRKWYWNLFSYSV